METDGALSPCWAGRGAQAAQDPPRGPGDEEGAGIHCRTVCPFASCRCRFPVFPLEECKCHRRAATHSTPKLVFPVRGAGETDWACRAVAEARGLHGPRQRPWAWLCLGAAASSAEMPRRQALLLLRGVSVSLAWSTLLLGNRSVWVVGMGTRVARVPAPSRLQASLRQGTRPPLVCSCQGPGLP